jgi:hypothetical protein
MGGEKSGDRRGRGFLAGADCGARRVGGVSERKSIGRSDGVVPGLCVRREGRRDL